MEANKKKYITVISDRIHHEIPTDSIIYVLHSDRMTCIITTNGEIRTYSSLKSIASQLDKSCFYQTHAGCYVNFKYVTHYTKSDIYFSVDNVTAIMSRRKYADFDLCYNNWKKTCNL